MQLYIGTTALTMLLQQALLRSVAFRRWYGFPDEWPLSPEAVADQARRRGVTMFANMAPLFRRFSALGEGDLARALSGAPAVPQLLYVTRWGLRDPGPPPPPAEDGEAVAAPAAQQQQQQAQPHPRQGHPQQQAHPQQQGRGMGRAVTRESQRHQRTSRGRSCRMAGHSTLL